VPTAFASQFETSSAYLVSAYMHGALDRVADVVPGCDARMLFTCAGGRAWGPSPTIAGTGEVRRAWPYDRPSQRTTSGRSGGK
jgi:hypothetical protein